MFNGVLLVAIIATWILKVTSLPKNVCTHKFIEALAMRNNKNARHVFKVEELFIASCNHWH